MCDNQYCERQLRALGGIPHKNALGLGHGSGSSSAHGSLSGQNHAGLSSGTNASPTGNYPGSETRQVRTITCQANGRRYQFCSSCKSLFDKGQYCYYCIQLYRDGEQDVFDGLEWICCDDDNCDKWTHVKCEQRHGGMSDPKNINPYYCPGCRMIHPKSMQSPSPSNQKVSKVRGHNSLAHSTTVSPSGQLHTQAPHVFQSPSPSRTVHGAVSKKKGLKVSPVVQSASTAPPLGVYAQSYPPQMGYNHSIGPVHAQNYPLGPSSISQPVNSHGYHQPQSQPTSTAQSEQVQSQVIEPRKESVVDFTKLDGACLKRYHRRYQLKIKTPASKQELAETVAAHFSKQSVVESEVLNAFFNLMNKVS